MRKAHTYTHIHTHTHTQTQTREFFLRPAEHHSPTSTRWKRVAVALSLCECVRRTKTKAALRSSTFCSRSSRRHGTQKQTRSVSSCTQTHRHTDTQTPTHRHTDTQTHRHTHIHTGVCMQSVDLFLLLLLFFPFKLVLLTAPSCRGPLLPCIAG